MTLSGRFELHREKRTIVGIIGAAALVVASFAFTSAQAGPPGPPASTCPPGLQKAGERADGAPLCTHGGDEGHIFGADVVPGSFSSDDPNVTPNANRCAGDGVSGHRMHFFYVYKSGTPNRIANGSIQKDWFRNKVGYADAYLDLSDSAKDQHLRQLCATVSGVQQTKVTELQCTPGSTDVFTAVMNCLKAANYDGDEDNNGVGDYEEGKGRIYAAFIDGFSYGYCGQGHVGGNNSTSTAGRAPVYTVIDCWDGATTLHEIGHNLGAVQAPATDFPPHATKGWHCYEESDVMCYDDDNNGNSNFTKPDNTLVAQENTCGGQEAWKFDCGHNLDGHTHNGVVVGSEDYWDPNGGTRYLATHWNTANSLFLTTVQND